MTLLRTIFVTGPRPRYSNPCNASSAAGLEETMLQVTPHHRLLLATRHVDFRKGLEGLAAICRNTLEEDPLSGTIFVFTNRRKTSVKILLYDGNGFWLCQKRFSKGKLAWWPTSDAQQGTLTPSQLQILIAQGNPQTTQTPPSWRSVTPQ